MTNCVSASGVIGLALDEHPGGEHVLARAAVPLVLAVPGTRAAVLVRAEAHEVFDVRARDEDLDLLLADALVDLQLAARQQLLGVFQPRLEGFDFFQVERQLAMEVLSFGQVVADEAAGPERQPARRSRLRA